MDKILMKGLRFKGWHGYYAKERRVGQLFFVDLVMEIDMHKSGHTDNLKDTVDYDAVYASVKEIVEGKPCNLIETVATLIADKIMASFSFEAIQVTVHKPQAPIGGPFEDVAVVVERRSHD